MVSPSKTQILSHPYIHAPHGVTKGPLPSGDAGKVNSPLRCLFMYGADQQPAREALRYIARKSGLNLYQLRSLLILLDLDFSILRGKTDSKNFGEHFVALIGHILNSLT